ncbi:zinc-binding alcohol dehydrogenase family protein [Gilvimarinus sp. SDUM040013]|uniref:Zinc-type alcohol dehydrogenase-like protein n=1 Tax=Gilvimarinus gilvus TaxID=3058038 RepID=A0ABU4S4D6_9GAMM|nr:zinc-binding alcohol dehydrogenase family protein [Gilvimarinus sp. SDUM040013]MDO3387571.1 zinc-binding alcohol dehydrogenase family protein [Gilvimarinus sp. SDUM040013]MDX6850164.1 zinc-binding alcohol dehydrogenase family protein [Gilvimarinus sp. SDUM040013]
MKAIGYGAADGQTSDKALRIIDVPTPVADGRDILVRVKATALNPVDGKIHNRVTPAPGERQVLGWDAAGVVEAVGADVSGFSVGDEVWYAGAVDRAGCQSQWQLVDHRVVSHKPRSLDFLQAAAMPLTSITAWELLFDRFGADKSSAGNLLVIGAAGGVGSMLIQLAKQLTGLTVIATASRTESREWVRELGADFVVDHRTSLTDELKKLGFGEVDLVASLTHTEQHLASIVECIAPQGKLGVIDDPAELNIVPFKRKSVSVHWEFMFTRTLFASADIQQQQRILQQVAALVDAGRVRSTMAQYLGAMTPERVTQALADIKTGRSIGKFVLGGLED